MTPEELQALWQQQPVDQHVGQPLVQPAPVLDVAAPTSALHQGRRPRWQAMVGLAAAALVVFVVARPFIGSSTTASIAGGESVEEAPFLECRRLAAAKRPDLPRARLACSKALEQEPANLSVRRSLTRITTFESCQEKTRLAQARLDAGEVDAAMDVLATLTLACETYLVDARAVALAARPLGVQRAADECRRRLTAGDADATLVACERYARFACQGASLDDDVLLLGFTKVLSRIRPESVWSCPELAAFPLQLPANESGAEFREHLAKRFVDERLRLALLAYFDKGDVDTARRLLTTVSTDSTAASSQSIAQALLEDLTTVERGSKQLFETISRGDVSAVAEGMGVFVDAEDRLSWGSEASRRPRSFLRREVLVAFEDFTYTLGKTLALRKDFKGACRAWKLGLRFSRANADLLKAGYFCSQRASGELSRGTCEALRDGLDFAVDGDGHAERIKVLQAEQKCH